MYNKIQEKSLKLNRQFIESKDLQYLEDMMKEFDDYE